jgi:asparagine synthase (glutamine-hydrolysing)
MCGICGTAGFTDRALLERMTRIISHRGPDDEGSYISPEAGVGLGNRRLSIIDLSPAGHMPMSNEDGSIWVTQNGEIYNFPELRKELQKHGHHFRSRSDTEVLIHGYEEWGLDLLSRLNGMFAFALLDLRERRPEGSPVLLLARDRFGIKPLYYWSRGKRLVFASEIKAILLTETVQAELNLEALHRFLSFLWIPGPATLFSGIEQVPPGHYLGWSDEGIVIRPYWELRFNPDEKMREQAAVEQLRSILRRAVDRHLISDVPVGVFLSGGLDSSSLLALSTKRDGGVRKAYTIAYRQEDALLEQCGDDARYARMVAKHFHADYHEIEVAPDIVDLLPKVIWHLDSPVADPAAISTYLICKAARPEMKVLLSGQGADEVFAGYRVHTAHRVAEHVKNIPRVVRDKPATAALSFLHAMKDYVPGVHPGLVMAAHRYLAKILSSASLQAEERFILSRSYATESDLNELYTSDAAAQMHLGAASEEYRAYFRAVENEDFINRMLYVDAKTFLPDLNLTYCDKLSSAASVEVRVPFLDNELIDFLGRVPPRLKLKRLTGKYILRQAMSGILPDSVLKRRKAGFGAPIRNWLRHDLREMVDELLSEEVVTSRGLFNPTAVTKLVKDDRDGIKDNSYRIWALLTLETWQRVFVDNKSGTQWHETAQVEVSSSVSHAHTNFCSADQAIASHRYHS